jgi:hypothetical protein
VLDPGCACREIVRQIQALACLDKEPPSNPDTSAYCQARLRIPFEILARLRCAIAKRLQGSAQLWNGLRTKVIDGTGVSAPDTKRTQRAYPQSREQKPGCGFPFIKLVGIFCLSTGALLEYARGNKHQHELRLLHRLLDQFKKGDLALADRGFSCYSLLALLWQRGAHCLFRIHHRQRADMRQGKCLGPNDRLVVWTKPQNWSGFRVKSVTLVTTLLDPELYPAEELAMLYTRRWQIELWFRDIKTSMGMEVLRCKSPEMLHKELEMFFIAYNLIRCLMVEAATRHEVSLERLSFKGTVDGARQYSTVIAQARTQRDQKRLLEDFLRIIAEDQVPDRPGRREPRAVKRRPKPFAHLNKPRHLFKDIPHRNRNWKNKTKTTTAKNKGLN